MYVCLPDEVHPGIGPREGCFFFFAGWGPSFISLGFQWYATNCIRISVISKFHEDFSKIYCLGITDSIQNYYSILFLTLNSASFFLISSRVGRRARRPLLGGGCAETPADAEGSLARREGHPRLHELQLHRAGAQGREAQPFKVSPYFCMKIST